MSRIGRGTLYLDRSEPDSTPFYGCLLLMVACVAFMAGMYGLVVGKLMPLTGNRVSMGKGILRTRWEQANDKFVCIKLGCTPDFKRMSFKVFFLFFHSFS